MGASSSAGGAAPGLLDAMSAMVLSVLPSPISSARIPPRHTCGLTELLYDERMFTYIPVFSSWDQNGGKALLFSLCSIHASASFWCGYSGAVIVSLGVAILVDWRSSSSRLNSWSSASSRSVASMVLVTGSNSITRRAAGSTLLPRTSWPRRHRLITSSLFSGRPQRKSVTGMEYLLFAPVVTTPDAWCTNFLSSMGAR